MISIPKLSTLTSVALVILVASCSSNDSTGSGSGTPQQTFGTPGGTSTTGAGGALGTGGTAVSTGGASSTGGATATSTGGTNGRGGSDSAIGGSASGGSASGGAATGGLAGAGSNSGGVGIGGSATGGVRSGGAPGSGGGQNVGGSTTGGTLNLGGSATGGTSSAGGVAGGASPGGSLACPSLPGAPTGTAPLGNPAQLSYQRTEMTSFIHFGLATYDGLEQCSPNDPPSMFNPTKLDATSVGQWVTALKGAGFRQSMLVTKHSCGFALWPSQYTSHSVKSSPWQSGKGDVVQLFTEAMKANDMRITFYLSPWDTKYPSSKSDYETYFKNQLTELFSYASPHEVEFDGFNAPTSNVNWKNVFSFIKQAQPNTLIWAGPEVVNTGATPDVQWIGNENGMGSRSTSSLDTTNCGGGNTWCPYECNTSSHRPNWFWHPNSTPMALADMQKVYFQTVGMNCTLNFNVPPSQTGEFDPKDLSLLQQFGDWYNALYKTNLVKAAPATADSTWASAGFEAAKAVDDDICTYWAAGSGKTTGTLTITPASAITVNLISIREAIELGERVKKYHVELLQNGSWVTAPTDKSGTKIQGTVVGNRQLWQLNAIKVDAIRLVIESAKDAPAIAEFDAY